MNLKYIIIRIKMITYTFYQIVCNDESITQTYVGSTVCLKERIYTHKDKCNNLKSESYNFKVYKFIRANGGWNNFKFIILDTKECIDKYEAYQIEQSYINSMKSELNTISPYTGLTKQEYNTQYNQENPEYFKQYYQENKKKLNEKYCCLICRGSYTYVNIAHHLKTNKHKNYLNLNSTTSIK